MQIILLIFMKIRQIVRRGNVKYQYELIIKHTVNLLIGIAGTHIDQELLNLTFYRY